MNEDGVEAHSFLSMLDPGEVQALRARGRVHSFRDGATLLHEGLEDDQVMLLLSGRVKVTCLTAEGREIVLGLRDAGDLVGELSVVDRQPRSGTVTAIGTVEALAVQGKAFRAFTRERPLATEALLRTLSRRFRDADRKRIEFGASDALGRVAARLVELCDRYGEETETGMAFAVPLSQEELAGWCGCSREAVAKALHMMRELGWITTERRRVTVLDPQALRSRSA